MWAVSAAMKGIPPSTEAPTHSTAVAPDSAPARDLRPAAPSMRTRWAPRVRKVWDRGPSWFTAEGPASWMKPSLRARKIPTAPRGVITSVTPSTRRVVSHRGSIPRAVAKRVPERTQISGFSVPVTTSVRSPSRPTEVMARVSPASSSMRRHMAVVLPAFLHSPINVTVGASPTRGASIGVMAFPPCRLTADRCFPLFPFCFHYGGRR